MVKIISALADGPLAWPEIQTKIGGLHGAVLISILNRMRERGLIIQTEDDRYRLVAS